MKVQGGEGQRERLMLGYCFNASSAMVGGENGKQDRKSINSTIK